MEKTVTAGHDRTTTTMAPKNPEQLWLSIELHKVKTADILAQGREESWAPPLRHYGRQWLQGEVPVFFRVLVSLPFPSG